MSSGGGGSQNTTTQVQQIPDFEQDASQSNQALAASLASQPYPTYQGNLIQGLTPLQSTGEYQAVQAANAYQPGLQQAANTTNSALDPSAFNNYSTAASDTIGTGLNSNNVNALTGAAAGAVGNALNPSGVNAYSNAATGTLGQALQTNAATPGAINAYMSPYLQASLAPQITNLNTQLAQQQQGINTTATQANAFGDARQGAAQSLQNYYGNQALNSLVSSGYNTAYNNAVSGLQAQQQAGLSAAGQLGNLGSLQAQEQQIGLSGAGTLGNLGNLQNAEQNTQLSGASQYGNLAQLQAGQQGLQLQGGAQQANLAGLAQSLGLSGANATYAAGQQQQTVGQQELNSAYQQYLNQVNWPYQMLNVRESALSNSPYNIATSVQLPQANTVAQGVGAATGLAGLLGSLGSGSGTSPNVFGAG